MVAEPTSAALRRWDPERIGPFTLLGRLGAGAMGQVYLGRSTAGRLVAVKTIKVEFAEEAGFRTRFAREVAAARRVSGVFTAAVVAADADADVPWLATAYIPAPALSRLIRVCGPLPVPAVRWLAAGCAEALESIHNAGLVHRDLKPSNVLVSPDGPRVIDFGVARAAERVQLTVTRGSLGTPAYMAPEQARDPRQASVASDVFSLGATLLFAATGHPPYQGDTVMDILVRLATEPPDLGGLPAELVPAVTACLARAPRDRPTSAALLAGLAPFVGATSSPGVAHSYLPGPALALIEEYRRSPQPPAADAVAAGEESSNDATFGSYTSVPAPGPARSRSPADRAGARGPGRARRRPRALTAAALAVGGALLVAVGVAVGASYRAPARRPAQPGSGVAASPGAGGTAAVTNPARLPPYVPPGPPPSTLPSGASKHPRLIMGQPFGDGDTGFVVHGSGFLPLTRVRVELAGAGVSRFQPTVDRQGTFNYTIDEDHLFYPGPIPVGWHTVLVLGAGGRRAHTRFQVLSPGPAPSPGGRSPSRAREADQADQADQRGRPPAARRHPPAVAAGRITVPGSTTGPPGGSTRPGR